MIATVVDLAVMLCVCVCVVAVSQFDIKQAKLQCVSFREC